MASRKQRVDPAGCEAGIESIVAAIDCVDESVAGHSLPQSGERKHTTDGDDCGDSGDGGGDWWGDGEACADTPEDLMDLCEPPDEEEWEGSAALELTVR